MDQIRRFGDFEVDHRLFEIRRRGRVVAVERRVFDLIAYLLANNNRVVTKEELFERIWQGRVVSSGSLTVAITAARRALRDDSSNPQVIITHRGRGYRFHLTQENEGLLKALPGELRDQFVGRDEEIRVLGELLNDAVAGHERFALLAGEPGIGKSRLIEEFASISRQIGAQAVVGRCREEDGAPPFWPWIQIARGVGAQERYRAACLQLAREAPEIARSIPELRISAEAVDDRLPPANARFRLFDGFARFLDHVCRDQTLVVLLDDVHRADIDSLLLLEFLVEELRSARLLIVLAHRPGDLRRSEDRFAILSRSVRSVSGVSLQLGGFSTAETSRLVRALGGWSPTTDQARALQELTGGNPFFIGQLAGLLRRDGIDLDRAAVQLPATARDAIAQHLKGLSDPTRSLLRTASVIGRQFEVAVLARAHSAASIDALAGLAEAVEAGVVSAVSGERETHRFVHALVRDVLYQGLSDEQRVQLHGAVGEALERHNVEGTGRLAEVAFHYTEAVALSGVERAVSACCAAADEAREALAYGDAVSHCQRALETLENHQPEEKRQICSLLLSIGSDEVRTGDRAIAKRSFDRAARVAERIAAPEMVAEAALGMAPGFFSVEAGVYDELLIGLLRRAQTLLGEDRRSLRALVLARLGMALFWTDTAGECSKLSREAWQIAQSVGDRKLRLQVLMARWLAEWTPYGVEERCAIAEEAIGLAREMGDKEILAMALLFGLTSSLETGSINLFDERAQEFRSLALEIRQPQAIWYSALIGSARDLHAGRFSQAEDGALAYFEIGRRIGDANAFHSRMAQGLVHASERGDAREILAISEEARRRYPVFLGWRASRCWALARAGRVHDAEQALRELSEGIDLGSVPRKLDWPTALVLLSETAFLLGRKELADELYDLLLPLKGRLLVLGFSVMTWGPVSRYLGLLSETIGRNDQAVSWYEQALDEGKRSKGDPWVAHAAFGLFRMREAMGQDGRASRELARSALDTARRLGMRHLEQALSLAVAES